MKRKKTVFIFTTFSSPRSLCNFFSPYRSVFLSSLLLSRRKRKASALVTANKSALHSAFIEKLHKHTLLRLVLRTERETDTFICLVFRQRPTLPILWNFISLSLARKVASQAFAHSALKDYWLKMLSGMRPLVEDSPAPTHTHTFIFRLFFYTLL